MRRDRSSRCWILGTLTWFQVLLLALGAGATARAQVAAPAASVEHVRAQLRLVYWECTNPLTQPPCVSLKKEPKERQKDCKDCKTWEEKSVRGELRLEIERDNYSYNSGPPRGSQFLREAARQLFGDAAENPRLGINQLWQDPGAHGWLEVDPGQDLVGTVAVWPTIAGVVVDQGEAGGSDRAVVLYPSHRRNGELARTEVRFMNPGAAPKFVVPRALLDHGVSGEVP